MAYEYNYNSSGSKGGGSNDNSELISWLIVVAGLVFFWPVGLFFLFRKLTGNPIGSSFSSSSSRGYARQSQHPYDIKQDQGYRGEASADGEKKAAGQERADSSSYSYKYEYRYQSQGQTQQQARQAQQSQQQTQKAKYESQYQPQQQRQGGWTPGAPGRKNDAKTAPGMQGVPNQGRYKYRKPVNLNKGKGMSIWGGILTGIFGLSVITTFPLMLMEGNPAMLFSLGGSLLGFLSLGIILLATGGQRNKKAKRFRKYLALIGKRDSIAISSLAQAMPVSYQTACDDLQDMLDEGYIPTGYLDMASGRLILSDEGLGDEVPQEVDVEEEYEVQMAEEEAVIDDSFLDEIKQINDDIADEQMSRKIDRIGEITAKILEYQRKNPGKAGQLRSFLSYYLPTTLKILRAYAQMEAQGIEGENIRSAKNRIEGMMDKVVEGFEKQLDKLFQDDAMDITTDVEVLERMLDKDGLSDSGNMFQMGG